jgi:D-alanyl-D-alanine carboxypeptidase
MLLHHTSGLYDFASDPRYEAAVLANPERHWTRLGQLRWALTHGHPYGKPGSVYTYSDTGYILLGAIIERATGRKLGDAVPWLLRFERLGLRHTRWEDGRPLPGTRQHQYFGTSDLTGADPSFDLYGGGGLIGTAGDLARFWHELFAGSVIRRRSLAELERIPKPARQDQGGAGLYRTRIDRRIAWFHAGFWGTIALEIPSERLTVTVSMGQAKASATMFQLAGRLAEAALTT